MQKKELSAEDILYMTDELNNFKGGMTENYVHVQLTINGYHTYCWESDRGAEIDFIIQREGRLIPIEVKSADNTRAKSLKISMQHSVYKKTGVTQASCLRHTAHYNKIILCSSQILRISSGHKLAWTSPTWALSSKSIHSLDWPIPPPIV